MRLGRAERFGKVLSVQAQLMEFRKLDLETSKGIRGVGFMGTEYLPSMELDPELWGSLQEELKQKIVARLPLKTLVQSQLLSKKWRSHFRSLPFQAEVSCVSSKWPSYAPLLFSKKVIRGYDRSSHKWETLFSIPSLPFDGARLCRAEYTLFWWKCAGSLMLLFHLNNIDCVLRSFVTNPVTKAVRCLPPLRLQGETFLDLQLGRIDNMQCYPVNHDGYRVVVASSVERTPGIEVGDTAFVLVRVYDSASNSWTEPRSGPPLRFCYFFTSRSFAHLDGVFYLADVPLYEPGINADGDIQGVPRYPNGFVLYVFDLETGKYKEIVLTLPPENLPDGLVYPLINRFVRVVVCLNELMVVVGPPEDPSHYSPNDGLGQDAKWFIVFRFDPKSSELEEISRAQPWPLQDTWFGGTLFSDSECIYMNVGVGDREGRHHFLVFNVRKRVWSIIKPVDVEECPRIEDFELIDSAFEPGLNPFVLA